MAEVHFHGFKDLPIESKIESPELTCIGNQLSLILYPGGDEDSDDGMIAVWLSNRSNHRVDKFSHLFAARDTSWGEVVIVGNKFSKFGPQGVNEECGCDKFFAERSTLLKVTALTNGTLTIEVGMKRNNSSNQFEVPFIHENPIWKNILEMFLDEDSSNVVFEVGSESKQEKKKCKRGQISSEATFHAHCFILCNGAAQLAKLCKSSNRGDPPGIILTDVEPEIFCHILYYIYGGKASDEDLNANAKKLIDATDKYGIVNLKIQAEAFYIKSTKLSINNILDNFLFVCSRNCALLKETVIDYIIKSKDSAIGEVLFDDRIGSFAADLVAAVARGEKRGGIVSDSSNYSK